MLELNDTNVDPAAMMVLVSPRHIKRTFRASGDVHASIQQHRENIKRILDGIDHRMIAIVGPCSVHHPHDTLVYARALQQAAQDVSEQLLVIMRLYFAKPRTKIGWKGMFYDPKLTMREDGNINLGARYVRDLSLQVSNIGLPIATEVLDPYMIQYIDDLVSWCCIGARTIESPLHRELASGLSTPVGLKNRRDGQIESAIDAIEVANHPQRFWGMSAKGAVALVQSRGNPYAHLVLRGGELGHNCDKETVQETVAALGARNLRQHFIVDCAHGNARKLPERQSIVLRDLLRQRYAGNRHIVGFMLESNLVAGRQELVLGAPLTPGQSITDPCIDITETVKLLRFAAEQNKKLSQ